MLLLSKEIYTILVSRWCILLLPTKDKELGRTFISNADIGHSVPAGCQSPSV